MFKAMLNLKNAVAIHAITEASDGFGSTSTSTVVTTLSRASIWQVGSGDTYLSEKMTKVSTHVLAWLPSEYSFSADLREQIVYGSGTYKATGHEDDVANRGKVKIIGLERLT